MASPLDVLASLPKHLLSTRQGRIGALAGATLVGLYWKHKRAQEARCEEQRECSPSNKKSVAFADEKNKKQKVAVNKVFLERLRVLLKLAIPGVRSKEFALLALHTAFLVARTMASIYVAKLDGSIVKTIVERDKQSFAWLLGKWLLVAIPATYINSMIRFLESKLAIAFRTRLVHHTYAQYMDSETYYRVGNLDSRLSNPDQCLTEDVAQFCQDLATLYSNLSKPFLDVILMTAQLYVLARGRSAGGGIGSGNEQGKAIVPTLLAAGVIGATALVLKFFTPPFGKMIAEEARRYGELRAVHSRVITHAEEIAFYGGHQVEHGLLTRTYQNLVKYMNYIYKKRIFFTMLEQFMMKYMWGACGLLMIAIPQFQKPPEARESRPGDTVSDRTEEFVTARGLLVSAADAIERIMSSWKQITELAGRTARVFEMITIFKEVKEGHYVKTVITAETDGTKKGKGKGEKAGEKKEKSESKDGDKKLKSALKTPKALTDAVGEGKVIDGQNFIKLEHVPIYTPNGDLLVGGDGLSFEIVPGMHLLITGPNGCGKSSLFRMLGGLWPVKGGVLYKPAKHDIFYIPQRPYLSTSCLRDQFIYPHTREDMIARGVTDADLDQLLDIVDLRRVVQREGGWDSESDWRDVLSGGEKQRIGMARIFYHKPKFAILDECTSAVSIDVEGRMYEHAKALGITLLTVTHRPSLWKYHTHLLQFDGQGGWKFSELNAEARLSLQEEKSKLEQILSGIPAQQARLRELCGMLGVSSIFLANDDPAPSPPSSSPRAADAPATDKGKKKKTSTSPQVNVEEGSPLATPELSPR